MIIDKLLISSVSSIRALISLQSSKRITGQNKTAKHLRSKGPPSRTAGGEWIERLAK